MIFFKVVPICVVLYIIYFTAIIAIIHKNTPRYNTIRISYLSQNYYRINETNALSVMRISRRKIKQIKGFFLILFHLGFPTRQKKI